MRIKSEICQVAILLMTLPVFADQTLGIPADVKETIRFRVEHGYNVGIIVGIVDSNDTHYYSYGNTTVSGGQRLDETSVFEIGSITKVFTATILADMAERGKVALDDPIEKYLPKSVHVPTRKGQSVTLAHLATHTSGLPRMPDNFLPGDANNPYADYSVEQMYEFLSGYALQRDIGAQYEYSNYGGGLLGHILALRSGMSYEQLFIEEIANELGMSDTRITFTPEMTSRLAKGHAGNIEVSNWDIPVLAGAGALRSTAQDMLKFLAANIGLKQSRLYSAMKTTHEPRNQAGSPNMRVGLGWHIRTSGNRQIIWHNGGTGGYHSFAGFVKDKQTGVAVLTNTSDGIDDIGYHLLDPNIPLRKFEVQTKLDAAVLESYVGKYELAPGVVFDIALQDGQLTAQLTGQPRFPIYAKSQTEFFYKVVDAQITFLKDGQGKVTALVLHQFGIDQTARRLGAEYQPPPPRVEVTIEPEVLKSYVGKYKLAPGALFDIRLQNGQLTAQLTGQQRFPIYAETQTKFFYKVVDAQITFVKDEQGKVTALVLHQLGIDQTAKKIE
jgi:D-alanyl-D-alanine-carboxypeptidase/D-alanyl-D-alanine-endopeptidase